MVKLVIHIPAVPLGAAKELEQLQIENLFWIGFIGGGLSLLFAFIQLGRLIPLSEGGEPAQGLTAALRKGTNAYLKWQLILSCGGLALVFGLQAALVYLRRLGRLTPLALLSGGLCALLVGMAGAFVTAAAGPRAAQAAGERLDRGVDVAFSAGAVVSFFSMGLGLVHLTGWFFFLKYSMRYDPDAIARTLLFFGLGCALVSLLFRMGALFARSAGIAAEAVDREMGLPPDDPQNPAAIADRIGHGVGPAAGTAAGGYASYENLLFAALFLGMTAFSADDMAWNAMLLPLAVAAAGAVACLIGFLTIRPQERGDRYSLPWCLRFASLVPAVLTATACLPITYFLTGSWALCLPVFAGSIGGSFIALAGEYFTSDTYKPARSLAETAEAGAAAAVTGGSGIGLCSAAIPVLFATAALAAAFYTAGGMNDLLKGAYGIALAGVSALSVTGISLASALCGPIGDCAAHAASLTDADEVSRRRADNLAAIGASAANGGQCLLTLSSAFGTLTLLLCLARIFSETQADWSLSQQDPLLLLGILLGVMVVFLILGLLMLAVRGGARSVLLQARRQFQDNDGLMEGGQAPDYAACVSRCATRSLLGFLPPALLALTAPIAAGLLLGLRELLGFLGCLSVFSVTLSLFFTLTGGVLGGARRYVESGRRGGRGSDCHRFALTAERAFASLYQAAGPALPALAMLAVTAALLSSVLIVTFNLPALLG